MERKMKCDVESEANLSISSKLCTTGSSKISVVCFVCQGAPSLGAVIDQKSKHPGLEREKSERKRVGEKKRNESEPRLGILDLPLRKSIQIALNGHAVVGGNSSGVYFVCSCFVILATPKLCLNDSHTPTRYLILSH